jgi:undecaprenyl-diphosphatase
MSLLQALVLGIVQGLTEFLPISSSAHLVLVPWALGWRFNPDAAFVFDVLVQLGTLVAVIVYFRADLLALVRAGIRGLLSGRPLADPESRLAWLIALATVPAALAGVLIQPLVEEAFARPTVVSAELLVTAAFLWIGERLGRRARRLETLTALDALWVGVAQAVALFPGISRSGSTIAAGLGRNLTRTDAARLSFLMSVPVMIGAGAIASLDLVASPTASSQLPSLAVGFVAAAIVGYLSIRWLLGYLTRHPLSVFAAYCLVVGIACLVLNLYV